MRFFAIAAVLPLALSVASCGAPGHGGGEDEDAGVSSLPSGAEAADTAAGSARPVVFAQCASCHQTEPGRHGVGPSLAGVFGAKAGHAQGYNYSAAMKGSGLTWDEATLDTYLAAPMQTLPGTKMTFAGLKDEAKRKEIIAYLKTL